jgi:dipeptidase
VLWWAPRRPDSQPFTPIYIGTIKIADGFAYTDWKFSLEHHYDPPEYFYDKKDENGFWAHRRLADWVDQDYGARIKLVRNEWDKFEQSLFDAQPEFEKKVAEIYKKDRQKALQMITDYSNDWLLKSWEKALSLIPKDE